MRRAAPSALVAPRRAARRGARQSLTWIGILAALALHGAALALILLLPPRQRPQAEPREGAMLIWAEPDPSGGIPGAPPSVDSPPAPEQAVAPPTPPEPVTPVSVPPFAMSPPEQAPPPPPPAPPPPIEVPLPAASAASAVTVPPPEPPPPPPPPRSDPQRPAARRAAPAAQAPAQASPGTGAGDPAPSSWTAEGATTPPGLLDGHRNIQPVYPPTAQALGQQGTVRLRLRVDGGGRVAMVTLERGSGVASLDAAAIEAARRWRFRPAMRNGQAVSAEALTSVIFQLPSGQPRF